MEKSKTIDDSVFRRRYEVLKKAILDYQQAIYDRKDPTPLEAFQHFTNALKKAEKTK